MVTFRYGEVSDADRYAVCFRYCGTGSQKPLMTVKGAKNTTVKIKKFGGKKINRKRSYTAWVEAKKGKKVLKTSAKVQSSKNGPFRVERGRFYVFGHCLNRLNGKADSG